MIVPIIGMHRSGTSALAGALHYGGVWMGDDSDFLYKELPENPKGFFENKSFRYLNDGILAKHGYDAKTFDFDIPKLEMTAEIRSSMRELIENKMNDYEIWGWKDPRNALTFHLWVDVLEQLGLLSRTKAVVVVRHPGEVADSLNRRNNTSPTHGVRIWLAYNNKIFNLWDNTDLNMRFVSYEELIKRPRFVLECLNGYLRDSVSVDEALSFIDPKLARSSVNFEGVPTELKDEAMSLYDLLKFK